MLSDKPVAVASAASPPHGFTVEISDLVAFWTASGRNEAELVAAVCDCFARMQNPLGPQQSQGR